MQYNTGWIGFDLDGTLAVYTKWKGPSYIGDPIWPMVNLAKDLIARGFNVKVFTARVASCQTKDDATVARESIAAWTAKYIGTPLEATAEKDWNMLEYYDDRAVQVRYNTGEIVKENI